MFAAHPAVREDAAVAPERRTEMSKKAAKIFERLLSQSCPAESLAASKHEGASGIGTSFSMLSQLAIREMFLDEEVTAALTEFIQHVDKEKLKHVIVPQEK